MKNKFGSELVQTSVFRKKEEKGSSSLQVQEVKPRVAAGKKYSKLLESMANEGMCGVTVQIPLPYYRRMRDYKDLHKEESFQSMVYQAIVEWVDKNA